jgi:hypothetical protein
MGLLLIYKKNLQFLNVLKLICKISFLKLLSVDRRQIHVRLFELPKTFFRGFFNFRLKRFSFLFQSLNRYAMVAWYLLVRNSNVVKHIFF